MADQVKIWNFRVSPEDNTGNMDDVKVGDLALAGFRTKTPRIIIHIKRFIDFKSDVVSVKLIDGQEWIIKSVHNIL